jgi:sensor histidine kinase regulating citrate/malate metabolism
MLDEMEEEIRDYESQNRTGNKVVDTILTAQSMRCRKQNIRMTVIADGHAMDFLSPVEICSLLGNALDNAIEAAEKVSDPEHRVVRIVIERKKAFLRICTENRYEGELRQAKGAGMFPETTKQDASQHGFGMRSMQTIAHAHEGSIRAEGKDGWFLLQVLIPLPPGTAEMPEEAEEAAEEV